MPTTVTSSSGQSYHLFQLPEDCCREPADGQVFTTLDSQLNEGYASHVLFGLNTGIKSWNLKMQPLSGAAVRAAWLTDPDGATVSTEQYVRNLWKKNRRTGVPFVYSDPNNNGQYYLVDFLDEPLSMKRKRGINLYDTTLSFRQRRINGQTVFDVTKTIPSNVRSSGLQWLVASNFSTPTWTASNGTNATATGDVTKLSAAQNGLDVLRLNSSASTGYLTGSPGTINEAFFVMKYRAATFVSNGGVLTGPTSTPILVCGSGTTKFQNQGFGSTYEYRLNGVQYAESNQQGPMNAWAIVHIRNTSGWSIGTSAQMGRNQNLSTADAYTAMDIGERLIFSSNFPVSVAREITEYLAIKYGITLP